MSISAPGAPRGSRYSGARARRGPQVRAFCQREIVAAACRRLPRRRASSTTGWRSIATIWTPGTCSPRGERDRSADQAEPDDGEAAKRRALSVAPPSAAHRFEADAAADGRRDDSQLGHQPIELCREQRLGAVALRAIGVVVDLDDRRPSQPAATAARAIGVTLSRRPVPWLGSARTGRCESC